MEGEISIFTAGLMGNEIKDSIILCVFSCFVFNELVKWNWLLAVRFAILFDDF